MFCKVGLAQLGSFTVNAPGIQPFFEFSRRLVPIKRNSLEVTPQCFQSSKTNEWETLNALDMIYTSIHMIYFVYRYIYHITRALHCSPPLSFRPTGRWPTHTWPGTTKGSTVGLKKCLLKGPWLVASHPTICSQKMSKSHNDHMVPYSIWIYLAYFVWLAQLSEDSPPSHSLEDIE